MSSPLTSGADWSASLNTPIDWSQWNLRLDYNISHSETLMFRMTQDSWTNNAPNGNSTLGLWGDAIYPALNSNWAQPSKQVIGRLTSTIGTSMVNDLEFAYSDNRINITPGGTDPGLLPAVDCGDSDQLSRRRSRPPRSVLPRCGAVWAVTPAATLCG